jgi:HSP20 family molecular chaperone IbpA
MAKPQPALVRSNGAATSVALVSPEELFSQIESLIESVAVRAYQLFEKRGREHGHDCEDWFRAEAELLRPVEIKLNDSGRAFIARAGLAGFRPENIQVSLEPRRVRISAKSSATKSETARGQRPHRNSTNRYSARSRYQPT